MLGQLDWDGVVLPINDVTWANVLVTADRLQGLEVSDGFFVTYKDEEGDVINVKNEADLNEAIRWAQEQGVPCLCLHVPFSLEESDSDESWTEIDNSSPRGEDRRKSEPEDVEEAEKRSIVEDDSAEEVASLQPPVQDQIEEEDHPVKAEAVVDDMIGEVEPPQETEDPSAKDETAEQPEVVDKAVETSPVQSLTPITEVFTPQPAEVANDIQTLFPITTVFASEPPESTPSTGIDKIIEIMCSVNESSFSTAEDKEFFVNYFAELSHVDKVASFIAHPAVKAAMSAVAQAEKSSPGAAQKAVTTQLIKVLYQNPEVLGLLNAIPQLEGVLLRVLCGMKPSSAQAHSEPEPKASSSSMPVVKVLHNLVTCDGCNADEALRSKAVAEGLRNERGMILGVRYKSAVVLDYDLCESCEALGRFQTKYGPFLKIVDPETAPEMILCAMPGATAGMTSQLESLDWRNPIAREFLEFVRSRQQRPLPRQRQGPPTVSGTAAVAAAQGMSVSSPEPTKVEMRCKHLLKTFNAPHGNFSCDICGKQAIVHSVMHGCRTCNFDVCQGCYTEKDLGLKLTPPPVPEPVAVPPPQAKFVSDVTLADGCAVRAGERLNKTWRVRNSGPEKWPAGTRIGHVGGDAFGGPANGVEVPLAAPGEAVNVSVPLVMPTQPGRYTSYWRLMTPHPQNAKFGHRFWVTVNVLPVAVSIAPVPAPSAPVLRLAPPPPPQPTVPFMNSMQLPGSPPVFEQSVVRPPPPPPPPVQRPVQVTPTAFEETVARIADFGFTDIEKIVHVLNQVNGDAAAAIERLLEDA